MSEPSGHDDKLKLEFETPQFLHSLFANNPKEIGYVEERLNVRVVTLRATGARGAPFFHLKLNGASILPSHRARSTWG